MLSSCLPSSLRFRLSDSFAPTRVYADNQLLRPILCPTLSQLLSLAARSSLRRRRHDHAHVRLKLVEDRTPPRTAA